jgi:Ca2+-binding EF-hand superfamily protein
LPLSISLFLKVGIRRTAVLIMFRWLTLTYVWLAALVVGCGCGSEVPAYSPSSSAAQAIKLYDANGDGDLDESELKSCPSLRVALPQIDLDNNGKLTAAEISTRIASYQKQALTAMSLEALILSNGQAVPKAEVTLVPEEFMKDSLRPAKGTANEAGQAFLTTPGLTAAGVQLGLYRVQISKPGPAGEETIPPQFNTETTVGVEVSLDVRDLERGITVDLKKSADLKKQ